MNFLFLQDFGLNALKSAGLDPSIATGGFVGAIIGIILAMMVVFLIIMIIVYVYSSFAYMAIAKKARYSMPGLAWIPIVGPMIVTSQIAKMAWWPILLVIGIFIPWIGGMFSIAVLVFSTIWLWKTFEAIKKPEWWAILCIIPILNLIFLGIAAWSK